MECLGLERGYAQGSIRYDDGWAKTQWYCLGRFFDGYPYQYEDENGNPLKSVFFKTDVMYMHRIGNTNILSAEKLTKAIPEVDWLHGHSGEILSVECAEN